MKNTWAFNSEKFKVRSKRALRQAKEIILSPFRLIKTICYILGVMSLSTIVLVSASTYVFFSSLPGKSELKFENIKKMAIQKTKKKNKGRYRWAKIDHINRDLVYAVVFSEDAYFFEHSGVNYTAMIDSLAKNLRKRKYSSGASTIGQQVAKNLFLTNEKSLIRKFKEILITRSLESALTKNQILEIYLNIAEFGPNIYGVAQATRKYFKKPTSKVNAVEGAFLAILLPSPRKYHYSIVQNGFMTKAQKRKIRNILKTFRYKEMIGPDKYAKYSRMKEIKRYISSTPQ